MATKHEHSTDLDITVGHPKQYNVFLLNDDYTSMDFVVDILIKIFRRNFQDAHRIMIEVHQKGRGLCGVYPFEVAETKVHQVSSTARENGFPLKAIMEEA
ncbi:MAG: ATP-dependent Clp protease adaptor ClpS [Sulfuricurvum sp.]|uniref:ATP-dependent Clp protease adaptor ClpS n=1 Tax=Sulfuricurvum sp. TaxID=2025608 RepID=UPI0026362398|nr:ATP-dependent Clp protease adaptor ClpS [Sulfuricurvum sp.]MDD2838360.1 ATP-dependent Clp protease adaptor ClpS [Sulfuricurvum sp.]MDD3595542.1 ATP-dependent Clp protease adaptor ClpS [Sulfuricurvum sp.]MDD4883677.1 ATP-dependent Clp protease adaptor ClpS [Sulfuricurvum sp.]